MEMNIINGKFHDSQNREVPPEFGNIDQIKALAAYAEQTANIDKGLVVQPTYETVVTATIKFNCICATELNIEEEVAFEGAVNEFLQRTKTCHKCHRVYKMDQNPTT